MPATFTIKRNFLRRDITYEDILTPDVLLDVCQQLTGQDDYEVVWDDTSYNKGRLAKLEYNNRVFYVSFSEMEVRSRNSFFQSFPSALIQFRLEQNPNKGLYFYFLPPDRDGIETNYFIFMYRLMKTVNTVFLNETLYLSRVYQPFNSISDIIINRDANRVRNSGNASTYAAIDETDSLQIFGKTYGANKYETILLTLAFNNVSEYPIEVYEIQEGNLSILPEPGRQLIINAGISVITSDLVLERREFETNDSLRSPTYLYNLLDKLGHKKCSLCDCEIPQIIQGAHIWPVASIKRANNLNIDTKIHHAINGDNGLWLCNNHHKLFDINLLYINPDGRLKYKTNIEQNHEVYLRDFTTYSELPNEILTPNFLNYLDRRNQIIDAGQYSYIA
jgi:type IV secretory pathway TrbF-like protein